MAHDSNDPGHGNSPAAWAAVVIMLIGFTIGTVAFFLDIPAVVWAGAAIIIVGLIVGWLMKRLGYGVGGARLAQKAHD